MKPTQKETLKPYSRLSISLEQMQNTLKEYIQARQSTNARLKQNERFWASAYEPTPNEHGESTQCTWLVNSLLNKHADAMDNYPEPTVLPRCEDDVQGAKALSKLLPVILRQNRYDALYSDMWWAKLKHGTGVQAVLWNPNAKNGTGDISMHNINLLQFYFSPHVEQLQQSPLVFYVHLLDSKAFAAKYPHVEKKPNLFFEDDKRQEVVDCYYKVWQGKTQVLHFCKFASGEVLFASEGDPRFASGFYKHGKYPFVLDKLYAISGSPLGFGLLDLMKENQNYINKLNAMLLHHAKLATQKRFFVRVDGGISEKEFLNFANPFIHVAGNLDQNTLREMKLEPLDPTCFALLGAKIEELKETSGNRDFNQGAVNGGITAASAIAALQEAGNKLSRDMIKGAYRAFVDVCTLLIEVVREFYSTPRVFRALDSATASEFFTFKNDPMQQRGEEEGYRLPEYDVIISAQKASPFSTVAQNELAKEFYSLGFFNPQNAKAAMACIGMMNFDGKESVLSHIRQNLSDYEQAQAESLRASGALSVPNLPPF